MKKDAKTLRDEWINNRYGMNRTQPQFESDRDRERARTRQDLTRVIIGILFWFLVFLGSLAAIGYCSSNGEVIDNEVERHINHLRK